MLHLVYSRDVGWSLAVPPGAGDVVVPARLSLSRWNTRNQDLIMPSSFDKFMPRTTMRFPNGAELCVGTVSCDDQIHQAVYLSYTSAGAAAPAFELELPPKSVDAIILQLQDYANQARFVNGERMLEYPEPYPENPRGASSRTPKARRRR